MKVRLLNSTNTFKFPASRWIWTGVLSNISAAARPLPSAASATFGRSCLKCLQFASQHPISSQRWHPKSRCSVRHRSLPGSVLTPYRRHQTHVVDASAMFAELDDDEDVAPPVSSVELFEVAALLDDPSEVRADGAVDAASCFLYFAAAEAPKHSRVPAAICFAASVSNSADVARSPIPLFNVFLALASAALAC